MKFQVCDIVSWCGLIGKVVSTSEWEPYGLNVRFERPGEPIYKSFTMDGRYSILHTVPSLEIVERLRFKEPYRIKE